MISSSQGGPKPRGGAKRGVAELRGIAVATATNAQLRVLSYNFNILPRGCGGFQRERISSFLETVDQYDVIMLQEVYAASVLPYFLQNRMCFQKMLVDELVLRGFQHYAISKQPSYTTMLRNNVFSDNGLIIASRFPIGQRGSYTFRSHERAVQSVRRGCLFAEVKVPLTSGGEESIIFFNVHLRQEDSDDVTSEHVKETRQFAASVIRNMCSNPEDVAEIPFVLAGDFDVNGINLHNVGQPTKKYEDLLGELQALGSGVREAVFDAQHRHPPTRPTELFFPTQSKLVRNSFSPQRQDYFFVSHTVAVKNPDIHKFVSDSQQPYTYLSDHFGVSAVLAIPQTSKQRHKRWMPLTESNAPESEETVNEHSNPIFSIIVEIIVLCTVSWAAFCFSWVALLFSLLVGVLVWYCLSPIHELRSERKFTRVGNSNAHGGEGCVSDLPREYESLKHANSVGEMWRRAVSLHSAQRCLGQKNDAGVPEWLTFVSVDARAQELASGLAALGVGPGDVIGVDCDASVDSTVLELACATYGIATLALVGKGSTIRNLIDEYDIKVVFAARNAVGAILTCRSRSLETLVCMHSSHDSTDCMVARDVCITLISYNEVFSKGRSQPVLLRPVCDDTTLYTMVVDPSTSNGNLKVVRVTHADALRAIRTLVGTAVLPNTQHKHLIVHYTPFAMLFNRLFVLGLFAHGSAVATTPVAACARAFATIQPTIVVATPSLFSTSAVQLRRRNERYWPIFSWIFEQIYHLRLFLINTHNRDSLILRTIFFRGTQHLFGGNVEKIVVCSSEESLSDTLAEHIVVCYTPCLREVFFLPSEGVFCVDGVPAPNIHVHLEPFDEPSKEAKIGSLVLSCEGRKERTLPIAAMWTGTRTLRLIGPPDGVLLPVRSEYVLAASLERVFSQSRYVNDVFLYAEPSRPIIAIISPNRDTVDFEWRQSREGEVAGEDNLLSNWAKFASFASDLLTADFQVIAKRNALHESNVPSYVHIHPHAFKKHDSFLTPYGGIRRNSLKSYFKVVIEGFYNDATPTALPTPGQIIESDEEGQAYERDQKPFSLNTPISIDVGGTFAKLVYVQPPGDFKVPHYVVKEAAVLAEGFNVRMLDLLDNAEGMKRLLNDDPFSTVGTLQFAKMSSKCIPDFMSYIVESQMLSYYTKEYRNTLRVTGGGAFKYAALAKKMDLNFSVMREMSAVVHGLGVVIGRAPETIFTVDPATGERHPHRLKSPPGEPFSPYPCLLVNIGSGISIIKCLGPDGSHVRIGGSPMGGATFWGLVRTMTAVTSWEEITETMRLDGPGDNRNVDLLVGDIYGYNAKDLPPMLSVDTVASTFGKLGTERFYESQGNVDRLYASSSEDLSGAVSSSPDSNPTLHDAVAPTLASHGKTSEIDIVRSLLNMISSNVTQLAYLHSRVQDVHNIFFAGGFVRNNPIVWSHISSFMAYWSKGECHAHFLGHDSHLGALGAATNTEEHVS
ncbi:pantothenate kinase subunit, putative [Trypanosoma equiperdum]|uniref:Pantothenate kinase subunit, putative n=1 Tax=Trypanosoma equiperdum TaxID=5694 RepID=A0A1G4IEX3_TRYEQ|nr:pantothenate kinase subunit, putative [Trypanosoma equiperdum]